MHIIGPDIRAPERTLPPQRHLLCDSAFIEKAKTLDDAQFPLCSIQKHSSERNLIPKSPEILMRPTPPTMPTSQRLPCHLLQLSPEILTIIASAIHDQNDLRNFSNTCHTLHRIVDPILYRHVSIRSISACHSFALVVLRYPVRAWEVQALKI